MTRGTQLDRLPGGEGRRGGSRSQGAAPAPAPELPSCRPGADGPPGLPADPAEGGSGPPCREVPLPALHRPGCQAPGPLAGVPPAREGAAAGDSQASVALACPEEASAQSRRTPLSSKAYAYVPAAVPTAEARAPRRSRQAPRARCGQWQDPTTVMMRNLPYCYTRKRLIDLFDSLGFSGK
ncbi:unnamed protein product [Prorocentrum cordatum]|uniref:Uncharacterized protein n=1 Tax=Prorocentrum cordatum TaxID=2364126 RepID=A0ABN9UA22_9DINO|nr:unnamed protein product [Polarella glacialis]